MIVKCPKCGSDKIHVIVSSNGDDWVRRRRRCKDCNFRFNTVEVSASSINEIKDKIQGIKTDETGRIIMSHSEARRYVSALDSVAKAVKDIPHIPD